MAVGTFQVGVIRKAILNNEILTYDQGSGSGGVDISIGGNTAGVGGLVSSGTAILVGGSNITLSQGGNNITIVGASAATFSQSVQTQNCVDVTLAGNTSGALALISSGTMTLAGGTNITVSQAGNAVTIIGASAATVSQSVQTQNLFDLTLSGNTSGVMALISSGTLSLAGGNGLTFSQAGGNAITAFVQTYLNEMLLMGG